MIHAKILDELYRVYLSMPRQARNPYPHASAGFAQARHVSKCCRAATIESKRGDKLLCAACRKECDLSHLDQRKPIFAGSDSMRLRETRQVDRGAEDRANVNAMWAKVALSRFFDPVPPSIGPRRWKFDLCAWALVLDFGDDAARQGRLAKPRLGKWTRSAVHAATEEARATVSARAESSVRHLLLVNEFVGGSSGEYAAALAREVSMRTGG